MTWLFGPFNLRHGIVEFDGGIIIDGLRSGKEVRNSSLLLWMRSTLRLRLYASS
jgi:hypothetical protein